MAGAAPASRRRRPRRGALEVTRRGEEELWGPPPERDSRGGADGPGCRCRGRRGGAKVVRGRRPSRRRGGAWPSRGGRPNAELCQASRRRPSAKRRGSRRTSSRLIEGSHRPSAPQKEILPQPYQLASDLGTATAWSSRSRGVTPRVFAHCQIVLTTHLITPINHLDDHRSTLGQNPSSKPLLFP
jgi:hypothetical protein